LSNKPRLITTRCILNPRLEPVISELLDRQKNDVPISIKELSIATRQDVGNDETIYVPGLTILEGGLTEGSYRRFSKRILAPSKKYNDSINLQELLDDYYTLYTFDKKIAEYLVINDLKIVDYSAIAKRSNIRIHELWIRRISGRRLKGTPLMDESKINGKGKLEIPLDAYALREYYEGAPWRYIGTYSDIDPIDLPTLLPAIFNTPEKDNLFAQRSCYIPPSDPAYDKVCFEAVKKGFIWRQRPPVDIRKLKRKAGGKEDVEKEEEE